MEVTAIYERYKKQDGGEGKVHQAFKSGKKHEKSFFMGTSLKLDQGKSRAKTYCISMDTKNWSII